MFQLSTRMTSMKEFPQQQENFGMRRSSMLADSSFSRMGTIPKIPQLRKGEPPQQDPLRNKGTCSLFGGGSGRCGGAEMMVPVYGRFGSYCNPNKLSKSIANSAKANSFKQQKSSDAKKKAQEKGSRSTSNVPASGSRLPPLQQKQQQKKKSRAEAAFDEEIPQALNIMWDPHVRRGTPLIHFTTLERDMCKVHEMSKSSIAAKHSRNSSSYASNPFINNTTGGIKYPNIKIKTKLEAVDYSPFLEEQEDGPPLTKEELAKGKFQNANSQTELLDRKLVALDQMDREYNRINNNLTYRTGMDAESQVDHYKLSQELHHTLNPRQHTINRLSKIMASQTMNQGILEDMECTEIEQIRGQCEEIEMWISVENRRRFQERRDYCKRLKKVLEEQEEERDAELKMKEAEDRVTAGMFAKELIYRLIDRGFLELIKEGIVPDPEVKKGTQVKVLSGVKEWLEETFSNSADRSVLSRNLLDRIIEDVTKNCPHHFGCEENVFGDYYDEEEGEYFDSDYSDEMKNPKVSLASDYDEDEVEGDDQEPGYDSFTLQPGYDPGDGDGDDDEDVLDGVLDEEYAN